MALSTLSREAQLLLLAAGPAENDPKIQALATDRDLRWAVVSGLAAATKSTAVLWRRLDAVGGRSLPTETRDRLQQIAMVTDFRMACLQDGALRVVDLIGTMGLRAVLLKGAALAMSAYGSFQERPMGDIDVLLAPEEAVRLQHALLGSGWSERFLLNANAEMRDRRRDFYESHHHLPPLEDSNGAAAVEVHVDLFPPGAPFRLPPYRLREAAQSAVYEGRSVLVPSTEHLLLHLCIHFAWSNEMRLGAWRTFRDLEAIITTRTVDWESVVAAAELARATTCCYWTLRLAQNLAGIRVPAEALRLLRPRLPEPVLRRVEYHFAHELLPTETICPSVQVRRAMWEIAIRPRGSGHGSIRPWLASGGTPLLPRPRADKGFRKIVKHAQRIANWRQYAQAILTVGTHPAQTAPGADRA